MTLIEKSIPIKAGKGNQPSSTMKPYDRTKLTMVIPIIFRINLVIILNFKSECFFSLKYLEPNFCFRAIN